MAKLLLDVLSGQVSDRIPFWFMRQAGRYLPEYQQLRARAGGFLNLCYTPELAVDVTLQPIRRFEMDAAILFSDILVIPDALGQRVSFHEGEGPRLAPLQLEALENTSMEAFHAHLKPVYETLAGVRAKLAADKTLIGFAGAPWTLACYMIEGKSSRDYASARTFAITREAEFKRLMALLEKHIISYLCKQVEHGADVLQLFDSWAAQCSVAQFREYVIAPAKRIVSEVKRLHPHIKIIGFPKGAGVLYVDYAKQTGGDAVSVDFHTPLTWLSAEVSLPLQGNMDPLVLAGNMAQIQRDMEHKLEVMRGKPYIFNLGHGIVPHTPIAHVAWVAEFLKHHHAVS